MKRFAIFLSLLLALSLCACTETPPPATTAPPRPSTPFETTLPAEPLQTIETQEILPADPNFCPITDTIAPTEQLHDFSEYEALLDFSTEPNWLGRALGCVFSSPEDVDLYYMFYLGVEHPGSWDDLSPESQQTLLDRGFWRELDLQIMPAEKLEEALQVTFGVSLSDVTIPVEWGYVEVENAYCSNHSDAYFPGIVNITAVEDDGSTIVIRCTIDGYYNTATGEFLDSANLILTLRRMEDGTLRAISNVIA